MSLQISRIGPNDVATLCALFARIRSDRQATHFHPHEFTDAEARTRTAYAGPDLYALISYEGDPVGYGLLRGWEQGFAIPSLGIYVAESYRGTGAAHLLMQYLHVAARLSGASAIRLKVYPENSRAIALYRKFGYQMSESLESGQLVGCLRL